MSSQQATLDGFGAETPDQPDSAPAPHSGRGQQTPTIDGIPNFNRERGREKTELGADLGELCEQAHEYEPQRERRPVEVADE